MKFTLKKLGRLEEATIDLSKDLIVLAGPNNTSKTYVAYSIYGFCKRLSDGVSEIPTKILDHYTAAHDRPFDWELALGSELRSAFAPVVETAPTWLREVFSSEDKFTARAEISFVHEQAQKALSRVSRSYDKAVFEQLFNVDVRTHQLSDVVFDGPANVSFKFVEVASNASVSAEMIRSRQEALLRLIVFKYLPTLLFLHLAHPFILTAERSAIQLFAQELSNEHAGFDQRDERKFLKMFSGTGPLSRMKAQARRYSEPINDGLTTATRWSATRNETSVFASTVDAFEADVLGGRAKANEQGNVVFTPSGGPDLDLHVASSSVKSLAPLLLYLRHVAEPGDFLIIDEPELNLHPDNQRRVARLLAQVANAGVKVMITTHSDYIIREINNLVMLNEDRDDAFKTKHPEYLANMALTPGKVGAYLFNQTTAQELEVNKSGFEVQTIDDEINKLNKISQELYFSLIEGKE